MATRHLRVVLMAIGVLLIILAVSGYLAAWTNHAPDREAYRLLLAGRLPSPSAVMRERLIEAKLALDAARVFGLVFSLAGAVLIGIGYRLPNRGASPRLPLKASEHTDNVRVGFLWAFWTTVVMGSVSSALLTMTSNSAVGLLILLSLACLVLLVWTLCATWNLGRALGKSALAIVGSYLLLLLPVAGWFILGHFGHKSAVAWGGIGEWRSRITKTTEEGAG